MSDRRYSEDEVSAIFADAVEGSRRLPVQTARDDGLTLVELQEIGREVGISPDAIAQAARMLDMKPRAASRRLLGLPVGVERTVNLDRWLTDAEWEQLVVRLRETFDARGALSGHGSFRQWTNGNLQALLEPTPTGHRLRLRTTKSSALSGIRVAMVAAAMGAIVAISSAIGGHLASSMPVIATTLLVAGGMVAYGALPLPRWARLRARQMDDIIAGLARSEGEALPERTP